MPVAPMLAEDIGKVLPLIIIIAVILLGLAVLSVACVPLCAGIGRGTWWGFALALVTTLVGGFFLLGCLTTVGGVPVFFDIISGIPFGCGLLSLYLWGQGRKNWSPLVLRILLYGIIIVAGLCLFALWVRRQ
jgi:hypothetical protein